MVFEIRLDKSLQCRARMIAGGHTMRTPSLVTYNSMVLQDWLIFMLIVADLNELDLHSEDIKNDYLTAPCREKIWTGAGLEFRIYEGKIFVVVRALYGLKSSGAPFRAFLAERLNNMGFKSSVKYPDVWYRDAKKSDCE